MNLLPGKCRLAWSCPRLLNGVTGVLFVALAVRMLVVCLSYPIAAYANNYDFLRQSSCVGLWEDYGGKDKAANNPERPVDTLISDGDIRPAICMRSSDNLFPWLITKVVAKNAHTELRAVGFAKLLVTLAVVLSILVQPISPPMRLGFAVAAYLILGDFAMLLYLNTLYLDMSLLIFMFASIVLAIAGYCRLRPPGWGFAALCTVSLGWFVFARQQYAPFAALVGLATAIVLVLRWRAWRPGVVIAIATILLQAAYMVNLAHMSEHTRQVDKANRVDTFLSAALPAAKDVPAAVATVGLPQHCLAGVGKNWYSPGLQANNPCPEVYHLGRLRLLLLFLQDPGTLLKPMVKAIGISRPALLPYIGHFERPDDAAGLRYRILAATSLTTFIAMIPDKIYFALIVILCLCGPVAMCAWLYRAVRARENGGTDSDAALLFIGSGGVLSVYALFSSVFGDGYGDMPRHAIGLYFDIVFLLAAIVVLLLSACRGGSPNTSHRRGWFYTKRR